MSFYQSVIKVTFAANKRPAHTSMALTVAIVTKVSKSGKLALTEMKQKQTILVPVDMEEMSLYAISQSQNLARLTNSSITLLYVHR